MCAVKSVHCLSREVSLYYFPPHQVAIRCALKERVKMAEAVTSLTLQTINADVQLATMETSVKVRVLLLNPLSNSSG